MEKLSRNISELEILNLADLTLKRMVFAKNSPIPQLALELLAVEAIKEENFEKTNNAKPEQKIETKKNKNIEETIKEESEIKDTVTTNTLVDTKKDVAIKNIIKIGKKTSVENITFEKINNLWIDILNKINEKSPSLLFILKMTTLISIDNNILNISLPYDFHQKKIKDVKNKEIIQSVFKEILGETLEIVCTVDEKPVNLELDNLAAEFGGQVI